jgi:hypothetical protein
VNVMRYTIVDQRGTASFVGPCDALLPMVAGCAKDPHTLEELLDFVDEYAGGTREKVLCGLAVFDERNEPGKSDWIESALDSYLPNELPAFRVLNDRTREASLTPVHAGVVLFNLLARRIVQIHNSYAEITRCGRGRATGPTRPDRRLIKYELPPHWSLVPGP